MYRLALTLVLAFFIGACASPQQQAQVAEFNGWLSNRNAQAMAGQVMWSVYYSELWSRVSQQPNNPQKLTIMATAAELIPIARSYEAGQITKEQFHDTRRIIYSRSNQEQQKVQERQQSINDAQAEQLYRIGNQVMQPRNSTTNCLTTRVGPNTLSTNCN